VCSSAAIAFFFSRGYLLYYGDAEAHLNIARRLFDSATPGYDQIGTYWLPLPHLLMLPFVRVDAWWHSGLAAAFSSALCFVLGGMFLFASARLILESAAAAFTATALAALNPNLLYLQSTAMTEPVFFCALMALLYACVRFRRAQGLPAAAAAGLAACAATLTRYEGWFVLPFAAAYFWFAAKQRRFAAAAVFAAVAAIGPLYWMAHGWYETGDWLDFFRGPYTARAIQGSAPYPGRGDLHTAWYYYRKAAELCAGPVLSIAALPGAAVALYRRIFWPLLLLALPGVFIIWSMYSGAVPIFMPILWPFSYYNTRYGLAVLPLLALAAAALVTLAPPKSQVFAAAALVLAASLPWLLHPHPERWVTWAESRANSEGRRAWTAEAAAYLAPRFVPGSGIISSSGDDFFGIYRVMGIPLRETFSICNGLPWQATLARPDLFLWQEWAVARRGDPVALAIHGAERYGIIYRQEKVIIQKDEPVIEIYRRIGGSHGPS